MHSREKVNILLVDDNPENLLALEGVLEDLGENLVKATSGKEALKYLMQMDFAAILLDVHMPGMDGFETAEIIRTSPKNQYTPIIFVTAAFKSEAFMFKGYSVGAVDYLIKPFIPEILTSKVTVFVELFKKNLELKQQAQQIAETNANLRKEIKKHQKTEDLLQRTKSELSAAFQAIPSAVIFVNTAGYVTMANPALTTLFGYEPSEIIGKKYNFCYHNATESKVECSIDYHLFSQENLQPYVVTYCRKDGSQFIGETINNAVKDSDNNIVGFLQIIRDITERQRAQEEIARLSHQKELILNSAGEGIYGINREGKTTFLNPIAAKILGYEVEELVGQPMHAILHHSKADGTPYPFSESPIYRSLQNGTIHHITNEVFWRKDRVSFPVEYISMPIIEFGETVGAVITFKDITERHAIERMKDEFISVVSHELRTPLTAIHGALSLMSSGLLSPTSDKGKRVIEIGAEGAERLVRLVNDILDLERLTSGKINLVKQRCNARDLTLNAINAVQMMADNAGVTLSVSSQAIELDADCDRIIQVLTNLLSNAIKFSPQGSTVELTVEELQQVTQKNGNLGGGEKYKEEESVSVLSKVVVPSSFFPIFSPFVLFKIKDRGRGIPPENIESIFERFSQVDASDSRKKGGTGLGLAICRSIVQQHGGYIWAESKVGQGSIFCFILPI